MCYFCYSLPHYSDMVSFSANKRKTLPFCPHSLNPGTILTGNYEEPSKYFNLRPIFFCQNCSILK